MSGRGDIDAGLLSSAERLMHLETRFGARNYAPLPVVLARGEGVWLWDVEGRRYLDMMSAYSAVSLGHGHPRLIAAAKHQLDSLSVVSRAYYTDQLGPLMQELAAITGLDAVLPMNTGAEAVETAIKAIRRYGYRRRGIADGEAEIIVAQGNFHGRTTTIVGFSSEPAYRDGFGPFAPGFVAVPFGDAGAVERVISARSAGVLVEPIQGEAGIIVPPPGYLAALRAICTREKIPLVFDEVQSGLGRTGRMFCFEHEDARPDGLILGKALGGGIMAVSAFVATRDLMDVFEPGSHGSTFGGNPLACAIARETLRVLVEENLVERSRELGAELLQRLRDVRHTAITEVRGKGLWAGVELDPAQASAAAVCRAMLRHGVLTKETHQTVIRFAPAFVITPEQLGIAVEAFRRSLVEIAA